MSDEIIKVLEYLCSKIGITIDWTNANVIPYVQTLMEKYVKYEVATSIVWIVIAVIAIIISAIIVRFLYKSKTLYDLFNNDKTAAVILFCIFAFIFVCMIIYQTLDIVTCYTIPEKIIYNAISELIRTKSN